MGILLKAALPGVMKKRSGELRASGWCAKRRQHDFSTQDHRDTAYDYAVTVKSIILDVLFGVLKREDMDARLDDEFSRIPYPLDAVRQVKKHDAKKLINRYLDSEHRRFIRPKSKDILIKDVLVTVKPDLLFIDDTSIEVILLRTGKPSVSRSGSKRDGSVNTCLELYAMLKYAQEYVPNGKSRSVSASYYFLRREDDSVKNAKFEPNFFECDVKAPDPDYGCPSKGKNVVRLTEETGRALDGKIGRTEADITFEPLFEEYFEGRTNCTEEECKTCDFHRLCTFKKSPKYVTKESKQHPFSDIVLSDAQEKIAAFRNGIAVVNAGAGAGKTMVICYRIVCLLDEGCRPEDIMLVTFTNSAAEEMRDRIRLYCDDAMGEGAVDMSKMTVTTFNSFCYEIVKKEYERLGFTAEPTVIDDVERAAIISKILQDEEIKGLDYRNFDADMPTCRGALSVCSKAFELIKAHRLSVGDGEELYKLMPGHRGFTNGLPTMEELLKAYVRYDTLLKENNLVEFADQELLVFDLLGEDPYYLERFGFKHIVIDEFQDTSERQLDLIRQLIDNPDFESLVVVGDDSQAIYGFRDTTPEYMIHFEEHIGQPVVKLNLVENYRSSGAIIQLANDINSLNVNRVMKDLVATRDEGVKPVVHGFHTKQDELDWTAEQIKKLIDEGTKPEDIAFIASDKYQLLEQGDALSKAGVPWVTLNPEPYIENSKVLAAISLAKAISDPADTKDLMVWLNAKLGNTLLEKSDDEIEELMNAEDEELAPLRTGALPDIEVQKRFHELAESIDDDDDELYADFLAKTGRKPGFAKEAEYIDDFYRYGAKVTYKRNRSYPGVVLVTAHSGKGLEWNTVFVSLSKFDTQALRRSGDDAVEEKRRLVFVSFTRARDRLFVTSQFVAFGPRDNRTYNRFFRETVCALGEEYDPIDHEAEARRAKAEEEKKANAARRRREKREAEKLEKELEKKKRELDEREKKIAEREAALAGVPASVFSAPGSGPVEPEASAPEVPSDTEPEKARTAKSDRMKARKISRLKGMARIRAERQLNTAEKRRLAKRRMIECA